MWPAFEKLAVFAAFLGLRWTNRLTGMLLSVAGTLVMGAGAIAISGTANLLAVAVCGAVGTLAGAILWLYSCRVPKGPKSYKCVAIAIQCENGEERKRVKADFIAYLAGSLENTPSQIPFKVVTVPSYLAPDINDSSSAARMLADGRYQLLIWGTVRTRKKAGRDIYAVRLEGAVTHASVEVQRSSALAGEMRAVIPPQIEIGLTNELQGFEVASQSMGTAIKYIIALAAAVSSDWPVAKAALIELSAQITATNEGKARSKKRKPSSASSMNLKILTYLAQVHQAESASLVDTWWGQKSNPELLTQAEGALEAYLATLVKGGGRESPTYWVSKALFMVTLRRDFAGAESLLLRCRSVAIDDPVWRLSLAFVQMVRANVAGALDSYDAALERHIPVHQVFQVEEYVQWWVKQNQGPVGLYLLSAMLNAKAKNDSQLALRDLDAFESEATGLITVAVRERIGALRAELRGQASAEAAVASFPNAT